MKVPAAATQVIESFKSKGTLGQGAEHQAIPAQDATQMDEYSKTIDYTRESDNEEDLDHNPKIGELLIQDPAYTTEITVSGDSKQGSLMEVTQFKNPQSQGVIFMETSEAGYISLTAELTTEGSLTYAEAFFVDRQHPEKSYAERIGAH